MNSEPLRISILIADLGWIAAALWFAEQPHLHQFSTQPGEPGAPMFPAIAIVWSVLYFWLKLDGFARGWRASAMASWLVLGVLMLGALLSIGLPLLNRASLLGEIACLLPLLFGGFALIRFMALSGLRRFGGKRRMVILGEERVARELAAKIDEHPELRTRVIGFFTSSDYSGDDGGAISTLTMADALTQKSVTDLVIVPGQCSPQETFSLVSHCRSAGLNISVVPDHYDLYVNVPRLLDIGGVPLLQTGKTRTHRWMFVCKRLMDIPLAIVGGIFSLPILALAAAHLHLHQKRVLERQSRCGRGGRRFLLYRFSVAPGDARNSRLMNMMEHTSLTELPQLWNVLCGHMSLVGPRPETPQRMQNYSEWHRRRLLAQPGITGWAQVHGLRNGDSSDAKTRFDLQYILNWSPLLDCEIILETIWTVLARLQPALPRLDEEKCWKKPCSLRDPDADRAQSSAN